MLSKEIAIQATDALKYHQEGLLWEYHDRMKNVQIRTEQLMLATYDIDEAFGEDPDSDLIISIEAEKRREEIEIAHAILQYEGFLRHGYQPQ